jgi:hypothetical protein
VAGASAAEGEVRVEEMSQLKLDNSASSEADKPLEVRLLCRSFRILFQN